MKKIYRFLKINRTFTKFCSYDSLDLPKEPAVGARTVVTKDAPVETHGPMPPTRPIVVLSDPKKRKAPPPPPPAPVLPTVEEKDDYHHLHPNKPLVEPKTNVATTEPEHLDSGLASNPTTDTIQKETGVPVISQIMAVTVTSY